MKFWRTWKSYKFEIIIYGIVVNFHWANTHVVYEILKNWLLINLVR